MPARRFVNVPFSDNRIPRIGKEGPGRRAPVWMIRAFLADVKARFYILPKRAGVV